MKTTHTGRSAHEEARQQVEAIIGDYQARAQAYAQAYQQRQNALGTLKARWRVAKIAEQREARGLPEDDPLPLAVWQAVAKLPAEDRLISWGREAAPEIEVPDAPALPVVPAEQAALLRFFSERREFGQAQVRADIFLNRQGRSAARLVQRGWGEPLRLEGRPLLEGQPAKKRAKRGGNGAKHEPAGMASAD
jgi:hypothetical protein